MKTKKIILEGTVESLFYIQNDKIINTDKLTVMWDGIINDKHTSRTSITRTQDSSENNVPKGTEILNLRQISIISKEEQEEVAKRLGIEKFNYEDLRPNIVINGIPNLTNLPAGTRIQFPEFTLLYVTGENYPCIVSGTRVEQSNIEISNLKFKYPKEAMHLRGILAIVLRPGFIRKGDKIKVTIPPQYIYESN